MLIPHFHADPIGEGQVENAATMLTVLLCGHFAYTSRLGRLLKAMGVKP
jgi:hypothetical protein